MHPRTRAELYVTVLGLQLAEGETFCRCSESGWGQSLLPCDALDVGHTWDSCDGVLLLA